MHARLLLAILRERRFLASALISLVLYGVLYLAAMNYLIMQGRGAESFLVVDIQSNWSELVLRSRAPFLFEPIGTADPAIRPDNGSAADMPAALHGF